jgi:3-deoxy-D-manno-octulosonic-acid transferase
MKNRWIFRVYNLLVLVALPFILAGVALRWRKRFARGLERWSERWGHLSPEKKAPFRENIWWWVHAVSLGEVKSIEVFLRQIPKQAGARVLLSVVTPEALAWAEEKQVADEVIAAPVDLPWVVRRVARAVQPRLFVSVESEFWPNLLREARRAGAKVALVNGRVSVRSYSRYKHMQGILSAVWECFDLVAVRQHEDASRFTDLGVPQRLVHVTGNLKYDLPLPQRSNGAPAQDPSRLTLVVGSSREGEEKELLPVMEKLRQEYPALRVIWAPRHIDRIPDLERMFVEAGVACIRKSKQDDGHPSPPPSPLAEGRGIKGEGSPSHLLWDSMGDLVDAYRQADIAVVGGSFVPKGGQNPLEPAALSVPVVFGPSMENFHGISEVLVQQGGARQVTLPELGQCLAELFEKSDQRQEMGRRARQAVESRQGATDRTLALLKELARA